MEAERGTVDGTSGNACRDLYASNPASSNGIVVKEDEDTWGFGGGIVDMASRSIAVEGGNPMIPAITMCVVIAKVAINNIMGSSRNM